MQFVNRNVALVRICNLHLNVSNITTVWISYRRRKWSRDGVLGPAATLSAGQPRKRGSIGGCDRQHVLSTGCGPAPTSLLFRGFCLRRLNCRGVRLIPYFHLVPILRMCGVRVHLPPPPFTFMACIRIWTFFLIQFDVTEPGITRSEQGTCFKGLIQGQVLLTSMLCSVYCLPTGILRLPWLEVFTCFFLSCKANARVYLAKTGHGPYSS
jgi:hypothetical protein